MLRFKTEAACRNPECESRLHLLPGIQGFGFAGETLFTQFACALNDALLRGMIVLRGFRSVRFELLAAMENALRTSALGFCVVWHRRITTELASGSIVESMKDAPCYLKERFYGK